MYAIVEIAGKQYKVKQNDKIEVDSLKKDTGKITFDKVLLYAKDDKNIDIGHPYIDGARVDAEILQAVQGEKIRVFKMKSKKRYARTKGFKKHLSLIEIKDIVIGGKKKD
ncbi:50S ribosomal protein L21 [Candidatus Peregrinibacteria bacterium]|nr:50S ribosomal protein L21 [Candidatus Peregrinibacteria bacterium]